MDLQKIRTLIDFVGRTKIHQLSVTEGGVTVRIFKTADHDLKTFPPAQASDAPIAARQETDEHSGLKAGVRAPIFGILHRASAPNEPPFVRLGDTVEKGQTLFIIEAMKVFNKISAPCAGRVIYLTDVDGGEVQINDLLAKVA